MPGQIVMASNLLTQGLRSDFWDTYHISQDGIRARLSDMMQMDVPSDKFEEIYGYFHSAPYPRRWARGEEITNRIFKSSQFRVPNKDWAIRVSWHENDRQDDQTQSLRDQAVMAGQHFASLDERVFYQILTGSTDTDLLDYVPQAPDGVALFSATDGDGANRFGYSGGNIVSGGGVGSGHAIRVDFFKAVVAFQSFLDTEGQPLFDDSMLNKGYVITYGVANMQVFEEAFKLQRAVGVIGATSAAAPTNVVMESGLNVTLVPTPRITDNDWFVFAKGSPKKPIFSQSRQALRESVATMDNSDQVRDTKIEYIQWDERKGYAVMLPYGCAKVNN